MAIDQTAKALNIASRTIDATDRLVKAMNDLLNLEGERSTAGVTLASFDAALNAATASTRHATGADYQAALTSAATINTFMTSNFHYTTLNKVRP